MKTNRKKIGSFEAKTHLSRLLLEVQDGTEYTITKRGKPVARLIPFKEENKKISRKEIISKLGDIRGSVKGSINIKDFINEGRKY